MSTQSRRVCSVQGCDQVLTNPKHDLCYTHWQQQRSDQPHQAPGKTWEPASRSDHDGIMLSSTKLGQHFGLPATRINLVLAELGWIEKYIKGWTPTQHGNKLGAQVREVRQSGVPYVVWPESIKENRILLSSLTDLAGESGARSSEASTPESQAAESPTSDSFREKFPAKFRSTDGHMVRSRAEMLIDNWLYMQGIVHAFERKLPIEEDVYCDFYLPAGKVYIEYWGMESDAKYAARKAEKQAIYARYNLNLVELNDDNIMNLDDVLPRMLLKHNIDCT